MLSVSGINLGDYFSSCALPYFVRINDSDLVGIDVVCLGQTADSGTQRGLIDFVVLRSGNATLSFGYVQVDLAGGEKLYPEPHDAMIRIVDVLPNTSTTTSTTLTTSTTFQTIRIYGKVYMPASGLDIAYANVTVTCKASNVSIYTKADCQGTYKTRINCPCGTKIVIGTVAGPVKVCTAAEQCSTYPFANGATQATLSCMGATRVRASIYPAANPV